MAFAAFAPGRAALAGFIASDLGPGGSYNTNGGFTLSGPQGATGLGYGLAVEFQVAGSSPVAFGSAQLALEYHSGTNAVDVMLMSDAGGLPGSSLETIHLTNIPTGPSLVTAISPAHTLLTPGTDYWLAAVASNDSYFSWMMNNQGQANDLAYRLDHGSGPLAWQSAGPGNPDVAFSISPTAVPAPSSLGLLGVGMLTLGGFGATGLNRRRRAVP